MSQGNIARTPMTSKTAKSILAGLWLVACVVFLLLLALRTPQFGEDASEVWKRAPTFVAPILALVTSFLFGAGKAEDKPLDNKLGFYAALIISVANIAMLFVSVFLWNKPILDNLQTAGLFMHYFSALTIGALNYFFMGVAVRKRNPPTGRRVA
jgi:uncharacterized membrane protein